MLGRFRAANAAAAVPTSAGKALEARLLMRLATAARRTRRWRVSLRQGNGSRLPPNASFQLPTYQSGVQASSLSSPGFILLRRRSTPLVKLELHCSLQWKGRSDATHECDVSVIPFDVAQALRTA